MAETGVGACPTCTATGWVEGTLCTTCYGAGSIPLRGMAAHLAALAAEIDTIKSKVTHTKKTVDDIWAKINV